MISFAILSEFVYFYVKYVKFRSAPKLFKRIMTSLKKISPLSMTALMTTAIALSAAAVMAKEVKPTPTVPSAMPTPMTPIPSTQPMPSMPPMPMPSTPMTPMPSEQPLKPGMPGMPMPKAEKPASNTIVDVASGAGSFNTLVAAVKAAGLVETLSSPGPFTVFAPTDAAFRALPKGVLDKLLLPRNKATLVKILTYHVVPGSVKSNTLKSGKVKTVEGSSVMVRVGKSGSVMVDKATVKAVDIDASNGIIHVIDKVLLPPGIKL